MKDPAFLFYSQDFFVGTFSFTDSQVGKYIRLLCLQHQQKELSEEDMINICQTHDEKIYSKFFKTSRNTYYNRRLRDEMLRREKYSESRRKNRLSKTHDKSYVKHMETETETETINKKEELYRSFDHLKITTVENQKLLDLKYSQRQIDDIYDAIENHSNNKKYKSLYNTARNWLKKESPDGSGRIGGNKLVI